MFSRRAFTLVELLVVVAIIVVLLALLIPGMDKAIYHAELAACATRQDAIVTSAFQYALSHSRYYPTRDVRTDWQVPQLVFPTDGVRPLYDMRTMLRGFFNINGFNDPLTRAVDFDASKIDSYTYSSYELWFGTYFFGDDGLRQSGMRKMGDTLTWTHPASQPNPTTVRLNIMTSDWDNQFKGGNNFSWSSHPDADRLSANTFYQDDGIGPVVGAALLGNPNANYTFSLWITPAGVMRSPMEMNAASQDGSVHRYNAVLWENDDRMASLPNRLQNPDVTTTWVNVPIR